MSGIELTNDDWNALRQFIDDGIEPDATSATKFGFLNWVFVDSSGRMVVTEHGRFSSRMNDMGFLASASA